MTPGKVRKDFNGNQWIVHRSGGKLNRLGAGSQILLDMSRGRDSANADDLGCIAALASEVARALRRAGFDWERHFGVGALCLSAQTRLFGDSRLLRLATALARFESRRWPYHAGRFLARRGAHVVGIARATREPA